MPIFENSRWSFPPSPFHLLKNQKEYNQVYIISVLYTTPNGDATFSYPILFSLMKNRYTANYTELFEVINDAYFRKFQVELSPIAFRLDCEQAVIRSIKEVYGPGSKIRLCTVHVMRNWRKHFIEAIGKVLFNTQLFQNVWDILRGSFFLPFDALEIITNYLKTKILPQVPAGSKVKFQKFLDKYMTKYYFGVNAIYPNAYWSYFSDIDDFSEFNMSTNSAEVINRKLKNLAGNGKISFPTVCRKLRTFKEDYLVDYHHKVRHDNFNPRRKKVVRREEALLDLVREFSNLPFLEQFNDPQVGEPTVIQYCKKFARVNRHLKLGTQDNDHSDIDLDQTCVPNFNETLVYTEL